MLKDSITVTQFNNYIKQIFDAEELLHNIKIEGEVYDVSKRRSSVYFKIKDDISSLPCVSFYDIEVKEGDKIIATGSPNYYHKAGTFNFVVSKVESAGQGELYKQFMLLKEKLEKEGLFDENHKIPIPKDVKRIGVVTSKEGAVIRDIINVTTRRNKSVDIVLYDTKVQGSMAENDIAKGIEFLDNYDKIDLIIVARGGGSLQDLRPFNTEIVARATYNCKKPIVSAVGHETDFTIIDFVADLRAPTPSASAELVTGDFSAKQEKFEYLFSAFRRLLFSVEQEKKDRFYKDFNMFILHNEKNLNDLKLDFKDIVFKLNNRLDFMNSKLNHEYEILCEKFKLQDPKSMLKKGYAKLEKAGEPINSLEQIKSGDEIKILTNFAKIDAKVQKITKI